MSVLIHDEILNYVLEQTDVSGNRMRTCCGLIDSYFCSSGLGVGFVKRLRVVDNGGYLYKNISYLFRGVGYGSKMAELLTDAVWVVKQMRGHGAGQIQSDVEVCCLALKVGSVRFESVDIEELNRFCIALRKACSAGGLRDAGATIRECCIDSTLLDIAVRFGESVREEVSRQHRIGSTKTVAESFAGLCSWSG